MLFAITAILGAVLDAVCDFDHLKCGLYFFTAYMNVTTPSSKLEGIRKINKRPEAEVDLFTFLYIFKNLGCDLRFLPF